MHRIGFRESTGRHFRKRHRSLLRAFALLCGFAAAAGLRGQGSNRTHYSVEDGLPQNRVGTIFQDSRGFIWMGTLNGAARFDGYEFTTCLNGFSESYRVRDNRIRRIDEDLWGFIWLISYAGDVHRFDPGTDSFVNLTRHFPHEEQPFNASRIKTAPSGKVWLISRDNGCISLPDSTLRNERYSIANGRLRGNIISYIHEDNEGNTWILTDNGLARIPPGEIEPTIYFGGDRNNRQAFHAVVELPDRIWFGSGNGHIRSYHKAKENFELIRTRVSSDILHLIPGMDGQVVIGTASDGILIHDPATGATEAWNSRNSRLPDGRVSSLFLDPWGNVWIQTPAEGISRYDPEDRTIVHYPSGRQPDEEAFTVGATVRMQGDQRLWVRPRNGVLSLYDPRQERLIPFNETPFAPWPGYSPRATAFFFDRQNNLWFAPETMGVDKITFPRHDFRVESIAPGAKSGGNHVRAIFEDRDRNLWRATRDGKIHLSDSLGRALGWLCADGRIGTDTPFEGVAYCIRQDAEGVVWVGTKGSGLYRLVPAGVGRYAVSRYRNDPTDPYSLSSDDIFALLSDRAGRLWIGTWGGGLNLMQYDGDGSARFIHHRNELKNFRIDRWSNIRILAEGRGGNIYAGTSLGLLVFDSGFREPDQIRFHCYDSSDTVAGTLANSDIRDILHTPSGTWLATGGGGVNEITAWDEQGFPAAFRAWTHREGLSSDVVLSLVETSDSCIWVVSEENVTRFDPARRTFKSFNEIRHLIGSGGLFSEGAVALTADGKVLLGYSQGVFSFRSGDIRPRESHPPIVFTHFRLFNRETGIGGNSPLTTHIDRTESLTLDHRQSFFNLEFAALDFLAPENIRYAYMLEGFEREWNYSADQRVANYTHLPPGKYTFRVRSTDAEGAWADNERRLEITMLPSFGETSWALLLWAVGIALLIVGGAWILNTIFRLKHQVRLENQLSELKIRFFTDISHEIRTPLALITAPVEHLLYDPSTPEPVREQLAVVARNVDRMLRMTDQILDYHQSQSGRLRIERFAPGDFLACICGHFEGEARERRIDFVFDDRTQGALVWADRDGLEKIVFNLLSNAFKYTPDGRSIRMTAENVEDTEWRVTVADQGRGIETEKQPLVFDRFFRADGGGGHRSSGVGLAMARELAEKHGGTILLESVAGKGSTFTLILPQGCAHYGEWVASPQETGPRTTSRETGEPLETRDDADRPATVLIVEDDDDLRTFLRTILQSDYRILTARNGHEGLQAAMNRLPDFVVSDVMMPDMDGIEMLRELKGNLSTSHIPVVLLTAKGMIDNRLEGLEHGADDYIVKPFSVPFLRARIRNLLRQRRVLQEFYCSNLTRPGSPVFLKEKKTGLPDREFLDRIVRRIEEHLDDSSYPIEALTRFAGISRTAFFRKIKSLTGMSPVEFVREVRIQNAEKLLKTNQLMVKEVCYMVGFTDLKYFTRCFKLRFGVTPAEFKKNRS